MSSEYVKIIQSAVVTGASFNVIEKYDSDFFNLKGLSSQIGQNFNYTTKNDVIKLVSSKFFKLPVINLN